MWSYERRLQFPVNIKETNAKLAQAIISQYGGPDGELGASMRYLSQKFATPYKEVAGLLNDIGTEELSHLEMVGAIVYQLTKNLSMEEIEKSGFDKYYIDHTLGIWPQAAGGIPFNTCEFQSKGDIITDLFEDMAAEQKARTTYDNILRMVKDHPDVYAPIKFLREREIVHFQRFGEAKREHCSKTTISDQLLRRISTIPLRQKTDRNKFLHSYLLIFCIFFMIDCQYILSFNTRITVTTLFSTTKNIKYVL